MTAKSGTSLTGPITLTTAATYTVTVRNGAAGAASGGLSLVVAAPPVTPTVTTVSPNPNPPVAGQAVAITVNGTGFNTADAIIVVTAAIAGTPCASPAPCSITNAQLTAKTATSLTGPITLTVAGNYTAAVRNGSGAASNAIGFVVNPTPPTLTTVVPNPNPALAGQAFTLTVNGTGFDPATALINISTPLPSRPCSTPAGCTIANAQLTAKSAGSLSGPIVLTEGGTYIVAVSNGVAGVASNTVNLAIQSAIISGLRFVPVAPCRLVDTRDAAFGASFGPPTFAANQTRSFTLALSSRCPGIPSTVKAYSLNLTMIPPRPPAAASPVAFVRIWEALTPEPGTTTVNSQDGRFKANAVIVPASPVFGSVNVKATDPTDIAIDINGYFIDPVVTPTAGSLVFYPLSPCRIYDSRLANGPLGGPILDPVADALGRTIPVLSSNCGVPATAAAYSLNATGVPNPPPAPCRECGLGFLTLWPTGQSRPLVSTLNAPTGAFTANAAIVPAGTGGAINAFVSGTSHVVLDINGYFAPPGAAGALRFSTISPCRIVDTRNATGEFGGPNLVDDVQRSYRLPLQTTCGLPASPSAYALSATVVPQRPAANGGLGYLTLWPAGSPQPFVSTLNALDAQIASNAAIVPAGTNAAIASFASGGTTLILDLVGFFQP